MASSSHQYHLCFYLSLLPLLIAAQKHENITLGSSLTAGHQSSWVSPSGDFAFGFQLVGTESYLLSIWFNKIHEKTITWSANRDTLAKPGSKLQLTEGGRLVLTDSTGSEIWRSPASRVAAYAAMLDTGNLVLVGTNSDIVWQSFDSPTDTILPSQIMSQDTSLTSRVSDMDYSTGRFQLQMQTDGNLVFYMIYSSKDTDHYLPAYDATGTFGDDYQVVFNQSGNIYVTAQDGSIQAVFLEDVTDPALYYQRAILEFDGVFRKYVYPRSSSTSLTKKWSVREVRPEDICTKVHVTSGTGVCGFNGICRIGDDEIQRPQCECPPGYLFLDGKDHMKGCKASFARQSCLEDPKGVKDQFRLEEMANTDFPDSHYEILTQVSEVHCYESCLSDCYCAAAVFGDVTCWKMRFPLSNGRVDKSTATTAFIKVRVGNSTSACALRN